MKISQEAWSALMSMFDTCESAKDMETAKVLFQMWLDENYYYKIYRQAWKDCCNEYDIEDEYADCD